MQLYTNLFGISIPSYGLMIATGVILANLVALWVLKITKLDFNDMIILEAYCFLGAFIGAKLLYLIVSYKEIDWPRLSDMNYFNQLMQGGFVFYGGLIGGIAFLYLGGRFHGIPFRPYIRKFIFLIPFIHGFGRIGCFMAGCCYGKPYEGVGAVVFPEGSYAPADIHLFPVQLVEAAFLLLLAFLILILMIRKQFVYTVELYLSVYAVIRFILEYYRYDDARGFYGFLSISQWISILLFVVSAISYFVVRHQGKQLLKDMEAVEV